MQFIGNYVNRSKAVMTASAVSGIHLMYINPPGWGKSEMTRMAANAITNGHGGTPEFGKLNPEVAFIEIDLSSPPEIIRGAYNPIAAMNEGKIIRMIEDTPYDPKKQIVIVDEIWRGNNGVFDALLHATSNKSLDPRKSPVFWATSNFVGDADRIAPLRDRFGLWAFIQGDMDAKEVAYTHLMGFDKPIDETFIQGFPSWATCLEIRSLKTSEKTARICAEKADLLAGEAEKESFTINPRRVVQWSDLLLRTSIFYHSVNQGIPVKDACDFTEIAPEALEMLKYAYPNTTEERAREWAKVATAVGDPIGEAIEEVKAEAMSQFRSVGNATTIGEKATTLQKLAIAMANAQANLQKVGGDDPRVKSTVDYLTTVYQRAVSNQPLE